MIHDFGGSEAFVMPLAAALVTGAAIGFEREIKAKNAGIKTHALVCFSSTLLMLAALNQDSWRMDLIAGGQTVSDPTRMAHGILTGIGFLGAGVIFRQGNVVHGLTTAASLWMTSALGILYGTGMAVLAFGGAIATILALVTLKALQRRMPTRAEVDVALLFGPQAGPAQVDAALGILRRRAVSCRTVAWEHAGAARQAEGGPPGAPGPGLVRVTAKVCLDVRIGIAALGRELREADGVEQVHLMSCDGPRSL